MAIEDRILCTPGPLTAVEFEIIKMHTVVGAETLDTVRRRYPHNRLLRMGVQTARSPHERWDGGGYPDGLKGEEIPPCARIMAVADQYDAMRARRCHKEPFSHEEAAAAILEGSGTKYDSDMVRAFESVEGTMQEIASRQ